ncbi:hypothetical protein RB595_001639 [Gaeumannomyces hyphopodioides]
MSVFGLIKKGRQAAKEHKATVVEKQKAEAAKPAYKHVPTHAAVDALASAPSGWRQEDQPRIVEQNRRRSAMALSGHGSMGTPLGQNPVHAGMPRVNSALSHVSYPSQNANPMVALPRTYSYHGGVSTPWGERPTEVVYSQPDIHQGVMMATPRAAIGKGKAVERPVAGSRASSKAPSPVGSSGDSASSQDELEMRPSRQHRPSGSTASTTSEDARAAGQVHRYHPSQRPRRPSDPPLPVLSPADRHHSFSTPADRYPPTSMDRYFQTRAGNHRPPVTRPGNVAVTAAAGAPPVPSLPVMNFGPSIAGTPSSTPSFASAAPSSATASVKSSKAGSSNSPPSPAVRPESPVSPVSLAAPTSPVSPMTTASASRPPTAAAAASPTELKFDFNFPNTIVTLAPISPPRVPPEAAITPAPAARVFHLKQASRASQHSIRRFDLEPASFTSEPVRSVPAPASPPTSSRSMSRSSVTPSQLPTEFDEGSLASIQETAPAAPAAPAPQRTKGKLSKATQGPKPEKKNRWSFRSKPTPIAS